MTRKPGRKPGRDYPKRFWMYATDEQAAAWAAAALAFGLRSRNEFLRQAGDHALTCSLFSPNGQPSSTVNPSTPEEPLQ
jgi:hypothetical protein